MAEQMAVVSVKAARDAAAEVAGDALRRVLAGEEESSLETLGEYGTDVLEALLDAAEDLASDIRMVLEDRSD